MSVPRKNVSYFSPYSKNVGQYPSQTLDYRTQHTGGAQTAPQQNFQQATPHFYQNRTPQTCGFYEDRQSYSGQNTPHFYRNKIPQQKQYGQRNFGQRGGRRGFHQQNQRRFSDKNADTFSQYFHSSMLEDPWEELMERHNAIHGSVLEVEDQQTQPEMDTT